VGPVQGLNARGDFQGFFNQKCADLRQGELGWVCGRLTWEF
jgi:hypothetical protein